MGAPLFFLFHLLTVAPEQRAPVALLLGPISVSAAMVSTRRALPGGEPIDLSVCLYAMHGTVGVFVEATDLEEDDQDAVGSRPWRSKPDS